jgi:hypothetical protein
VPGHQIEGLDHVGAVAVARERGQIAAGSEMVPWGKQAVGADDTQDFTASQNIVYMIDGVAMIDGTQQIHSDVNLTISTAVNAHYIPVGNRAIMAPGHANHVAGILGARISPPAFAVSLRASRSST